MKLVTLLLAISLVGCSANWHLKQAIKKEPSLLLYSRITVLDTVYIPRVSIDSILITTPQDTVILSRDNLTIRVERSWDTLTIQGECKADTVYTEKVVVTPPRIIYKEKLPWWWWIPVAVVAFLFIRRAIDKFLSA